VLKLLRVEIALERLVITLVSITFKRIRVKITLECETLRVKSHSAGGNCNLLVETTLVRVEITRASCDHIRACQIHTMRVELHYAFEHHTIRVNITLCVLTSHYVY
jgi:hypothetical protein